MLSISELSKVSQVLLNKFNNNYATNILISNSSLEILEKNAFSNSYTKNSGCGIRVLDYSKINSI